MTGSAQTASNSAARVSPSHGESRGFESRLADSGQDDPPYASVAQQVERCVANPEVTGSNPVGCFVTTGQVPVSKRGEGAMVFLYRFETLMPILCAHPEQRPRQRRAELAMLRGRLIR